MVQRDGHGGIAAAKGFSGGWPVPAKPCDSCKSASALLFCRADSAFLCLACDAKVHGANKLASRHERVWMCEVCEQAPASVTCKADAAALCVSCDADIHSANPLARRHERFPVVPFFEPASAALIKSTTASLLNDDDDDGNSKVKPVPEDDENNDNDVLRGREEAEAASWLLLNPNAKVMEAPVFKASDFFFSDVDPYLDLDYGPPMEPRFGMRNSSAMDSVVPVQTMPTSTLPPPHLPPSSDPHYFDAADYGRPKPCYSYTTPSISHSVSSSSLDVGVVPDGAGISYGGSVVKGGMDMTSGGGAGQLVGVDREARVLRYREKRKNRKFEKTIRYASRKAYAETRPRIKGRFAKRAEVDGDLDRIFSSAAAMMADTAGYGVVPSF